MITYNDIYEAARKERYSEQLQRLAKNFISEVSAYLKEKKDIAAKDDDVFSDVIIKTKKQLENAVTLFKELMLRRRKKILNLVLIAAETGISKQDFDNMLSVEKDMFESFMKCIESSDKSISENLNGKEKGLEKNELIVFKEDVEELVDLNGDKIGPFEKGQIANLSKEIAKILIDDSKAELVVE
jgi:DNA replication initiation complex subunit (GINS family)